jgi:polar amino acid transport system substrate-binding protein
LLLGAGWLAVLLGRAPAADFNADRLRERLKEGVLRYGGDAEGGAPFQLRDPRDPENVIGFEVELMDALAEVLGERLGIPLRAEFVQYDWVSLGPGLTKRDFDVIISGYEITPERQEELLFTRPYYIFNQQLVVRRDEENIQTVEDCRGKSVGTLSDSAAERILKKLEDVDIVAFDGQVEPYLDLELGRLDAVLLDAPIALYYASTNPKLKLLPGQMEQGKYGIALRLDDTDLAAALDEALGKLMASGRMQQIYRKWHLWNADQAHLASDPRQLEGLGFTVDGRPLNPDEPPPADAVDIDIIASSAKLWTLDQYAPLLLKAAGMTVFLSVCSMALAMGLGLVVSLCRLYGPGPLRWLALGYVEFFRGIPLLLLLFFLYFGLSSYGVQMPAVVTAIVGFGLNYAAYEAEIYRSAILSVPAGQWEAAWALGMSGPLTFRRVIFPQAFRTALAPMTNDFVALFKDTSLVSVIAVRELTKEYLILSRSSMKFVELGLLTAALYLIMSVPLGYLSRYLEKRWSRGV